MSIIQKDGRRQEVGTTNSWAGALVMAAAFFGGEPPAAASSPEADKVPAVRQTEVDVPDNTVRAPVLVVNPLTIRSAAIPFDQFKAEQIPGAIKELIQRASDELTAIKEVKGPRTFENTMLPFDNAAKDLSYAMSIITQLESVATTPEWRKANDEVRPKVAEFETRITIDEGLWKAFQDYAATQDAATLAPHRERFLKKTIGSFRRNGAELDAIGKERLVAIDSKLGELTGSFRANVLDATKKFEFTTTDIKDLAGLPPSVLELGKESAAAKGLEGWRFTLQAPSLFGILTHADNRALREHFYRARNTLCTEGEFSNKEVMKEILGLRRERASLLGFSDFSDLILADRMAGSGRVAAGFLKQLEERVAPFVAKETEELGKFVQERFGVDPKTLQPWDGLYYEDKMRRELYQFDDELVKPYLPLTAVMKGLFEITERLFDVTVKPNPGLPTWAPEVTAHSMYDNKTNSLLGHFYVDLFPRENKRAGAWMADLTVHANGDGPDMPHVGLIAGNFSPPSGDAPALLNHSELVTLFHEFGHLLQLMFNTTELRSQSATNIAWDAVEIPSQINENWAWQPEALAIVAKHYKTGEPLPSELLEKMLKARNFRGASAKMRQIGLATVDLGLHMQYDPLRDGDIVDFTRNITQKFTPFPLPQYYAQPLHWTHIGGSPIGYAAAYYGYEWSEVYAADVFNRFKKEGPLNRATGGDLRDKILSRGDSLDPVEMFESFSGRKVDLGPFLEANGLRKPGE